MGKVIFSDKNVYGTFTLYEDHIESSYKKLGMGNAEDYSIRYSDIKSFEFINAYTILYKFLHLILKDGNVIDFYISKKSIPDWEKYLSKFIKSNNETKEETNNYIPKSTFSLTPNKVLFICIGCIILMATLSLVNSGDNSEKTKLEDYLDANGYTLDTNNCYVNTITDSDGETQNVKFCLSECKYYSSFEAMNDSFELDMRTTDIEYDYSGIHYTLDSSTKNYDCTFSNSSLYSSNKSYYCKLANGLSTKLLKTYVEITIDDADIQTSKFCK